jgi:hypothetical protein
MNSRIWRASALVGSVMMVVMLATQRAAGQPPTTNISGTVQRNPQSILTNTEALNVQAIAPLPAIPESASLLLLGSAFAVVARQLRRSV